MIGHSQPFKGICLPVGHLTDKKSHSQWTKITLVPLQTDTDTEEIEQVLRYPRLIPLRPNPVSGQPPSDSHALMSRNRESEKRNVYGTLTRDHVFAKDHTKVAWQALGVLHSLSSQYLEYLMVETVYL